MGTRNNTIWITPVEPAANTAAVSTIAAVAGKRRVIEKIVASYSGTPTGGNLMVESPAATKYFSTDITASGPQRFTITLPGGINTNVVVTLAAGGAGISGKLSVGYFEETG